jgi:hypothetical protein
MENSRLYGITQYLLASHIGRGMQATQQLEISNGPRWASRVLPFTLL